MACSCADPAKKAAREERRARQAATRAQLTEQRKQKAEAVKVSK